MLHTTACQAEVKQKGLRVYDLVVNNSKDLKERICDCTFSSTPAVFRMALSTLSLARNKNSFPTNFSNPQRSMNSMPPCRFPTHSFKVGNKQTKY
jgi:hypothetical protein